MSKGSARRPRFVPLAQLEAQWERTFGTQTIPRDKPLDALDFRVTVHSECGGVSGTLLYPTTPDSKLDTD